jgi:hypothetical protein
MSKNFARAVFSFTLLFFCAFFIWPIIQILKGGFIDADGKLTFAYLGSPCSPTRSTSAACANSFLLALRDHHLCAADRPAAGVRVRPVSVSGQGLARLAHPRADDPAALRRGHRHQADLRAIRRAQRLLI